MQSQTPKAVTRRVQFKKRHHQKADPKKRQLLFVVAILLSIFFTVVAIRLALYLPELTNQETVQTKGLELTLSMNKTNYSAGEPISISLVAKNVSPKNIRLEFDQKREFDVIVQRDVNLLFAQIPRVIWQLSSDEPKEDSSKHFHTLEIKAGEERTFQSVWEQKDLNGKPVRPGDYIITASLKADNYNTQLKLRGHMNPK